VTEDNYMKPWTKGNCDRCGMDFQITRTEVRARKLEELCGECAAWDRGYKEGVAQGWSETVPACTVASHLSPIDPEIFFSIFQSRYVATFPFSEPRPSLVGVKLQPIIDALEEMEPHKRSTALTNIITHFGKGV